MAIPHADFLMKWLDDQTVQFRYKNTNNAWQTLDGRDEVFEVPEMFSEIRYEFRLAPKEKFIYSVLNGETEYIAISHPRDSAKECFNHADENRLKIHCVYKLVEQL